MSRSGAPEPAQLQAGELSVAIVASSWHEQIMQGLIDGAEQTLAAAGVSGRQLIRVPGTFELALAAQRVAPKVDAVVALGVVIRGGTPHFDYVCRAATDGLLRVSLDTGKPIGFGVLTCDDEAQALDRAGLPGSAEDKGAEAAAAALELELRLRAFEAGTSAAP
jgi:6,7-dimethyl-8-ribityllumazine synthase